MGSCSRRFQAGYRSAPPPVLVPPANRPTGQQRIGETTESRGVSSHFHPAQEREQGGRGGEREQARHGMPDRTQDAASPALHNKRKERATQDIADHRNRESRPQRDHAPRP